MMSIKEMISKAIEDGYMVQIRKFHRAGQWSAWKTVSLATALHKISVFVQDDGSTYCPYEYRIAYEYNGEIVAR